MTWCLPDRYLYWSDISDNNPRIERMGLDATNRTVIVKDEISKPYGLTLDYINDHIYWSNEKKYIEFANLDGTNRRKGHTHVTHTYLCTHTCMHTRTHARTHVDSRVNVVD